VVVGASQVEDAAGRAGPAVLMGNEISGTLALNRERIVPTENAVTSVTCARTGFDAL